MSYYERTKLKKESGGLGFLLFTSALFLYIIPLSMSEISSIFHIYALNPTLEPIISAATSIGSLFIVGAVYSKLSASPLSDLVPVQGVRFGLLFPLVLITLTVSFVSSYMTDILLTNLSSIGIQSKNYFESDYDNAYSVVLQIISVAVVPALVEEFVFRGIILHKLLPYGSTFAIMLSSVLFALLHGNIVQIPFTFIAGLAMAFTVVKTNSLLPSIISHFLINLSSVAMEAMKNYGVDEALQNTIYFILLFIIVLGGILSALILSRNKNLFSVKKSKYNFKECMGASLGSVGMVFALIFLIGRTVVNTI